MGHLRDIQTQRMWLLCIGAGTLVLGLILSPFVARALPFRLNEHVAAMTVGKDRSEAGQQLMEAGNPQSFRLAVVGYQLAALNDEEIKGCQEAARKAKKEQACSIAVPVP